MMEFLRAKATRTRVSEAIYILLNGLVPIAIFFLVRNFDQPWPAIALVLLMKWRIFALRPRYWWTTLKINMVDIVVGLSIIGLMYGAAGNMVVQILLAALYAGWLLIIKPMSNDRGVMLQAGVAQFLGLTALFQFYFMPEALAIIASWLIGYVVARHVASNYDEPHIELLAGLWGLFVAELSWLAWRWTVTYDVGLPIRIPQIALIMLVIGFCAARMHHASKQDKLSPTSLRNTAIFGAALLAVILIFSPWDATV